MHTIFLCAQGHISGCVHAKNVKRGMKHLYTISRGWDNIPGKDQARKQVCMLTVLLHAWDHILRLGHLNLKREREKDFYFQKTVMQSFNLKVIEC